MVFLAPLDGNYCRILREYLIPISEMMELIIVGELRVGLDLGEIMIIGELRAWL